MKPNRVWKIEEIKNLLQSNDSMVEKSVLQIYQHQTSDEQTSEHTKHLNGVGFNGFDAEFGSSIAKRLLAGNKLSHKQIAATRKMITKYAKQLTNIANSG